MKLEDLIKGWKDEAFMSPEETLNALLILHAMNAAVCNMERKFRQTRKEQDGAEQFTISFGPLELQAMISALTKIQSLLAHDVNAVLQVASMGKVEAILAQEEAAAKAKEGTPEEP